MRRRSKTGLEQLWSLSGIVFQALILGGALAAVAGWNASAWLLVAAVAGMVASHLAISVVSYRRTMGRPWPQVEPLHDDPSWDD